MNPFGVSSTAHLDLALIDEYTRNVQRAVIANRDRDKRERHLDSLYYWSGVTPK